MKRITYIILVLSAITLTACNDFLEEKQRSALTEEEAFGSLNALKNNAVLSLYNYIGGNQNSQGLQGTGRGVYDLNTMTTDEAITPIRGGDWYDGGFWEHLFLHSWGPSTAALEDTWNYLFKVVMLSNKYLEQVENYKEQHPEVSSTTMNQYIAEIRAVRAMFYFYLMDLYGRVPIVRNSKMSSSDMKLAKRSEVFDFILKELLFANEHLIYAKSNTFGDYYGRITRPVSSFLLAKLFLNAEIYMDDDWTDGVYLDGKNLTFFLQNQEMNVWEACQHFCKEIELYFNYSLEPYYTTNFCTTNETSTENIFTIPMDPNLYSNWNIYLFRSRNCCHGSALGGGSENGPCATIETLRTFKYGTPEEDDRFRFTFYADTIYADDGSALKMDDGVTPLVYYPWEVKLNLTGSPYVELAGARFGKYENDPNANADGRACHNDIVLFRFADLLLMHAEAKVRNGEDGSVELNLVRNRVNLPEIEATLDNILTERALELAWEGWRRNDLVRYHLYTRPYTDRPQLQNEASGYTTVFPIPSTMLDLHPTWKQNPGYE
ncbi:MAG: RagB/SusD family nutrient uptake outer membrane protein [Bacteroidaceae bacterium]|nr:RagB/SusD family nutrient uptake outer membrane protein [Bacteroidaceae bacterium]